jgi:hypothetical protein
MMKADYDSQGDTIQIELEPVDRLGGGSDVVEGGKVIVGFYGGRPVLIDVIGTRAIQASSSLCGLPPRGTSSTPKR